MQSQSLKIMAVDDDEFNLEILVKNLSDAGYQTIGCSDGEEAWKMLEKNPQSVDIVLLDKMMPKMNGIDVIKKMQQHPVLSHIPVILQTGDVGLQEMKEGLEAGAYYYLCKPFDPTIMIALIKAAVRDFVQRNESYLQLKQETTMVDMIAEGTFIFRTIEEAKRLAAALSHNANHPDRVNTALLELMVNAVEHGNLNIGYEGKGKLLSTSDIDVEITRRLALPENKDKIVEVRVKNRDNETEVTICDEGNGFRWDKFIEFDPIRLTELNGRGIATAKLMGADVRYIEPGNKVMCTFKKKSADNANKQKQEEEVHTV